MIYPNITAGAGYNDPCQTKQEDFIGNMTDKMTREELVDFGYTEIPEVNPLFQPLISWLRPESKSPLTQATASDNEQN